MPSQPRPLSGYPEWLPPQRIVEQQVVDTLRRTFELHGFVSVETRAVEPLEVIQRKGEIDKEVYVVRRLHADSGDDLDPAKTLALHFDMTVPFARYVLENAGKLEFPFRRYQIQKAWRGERPQEGRYREFLQADIDIVDRDNLPAHYDVELPLVVADAVAALPLPPLRMNVNNRKLAEGFYRGIGIEEPAEVLQRVDKLDKVGPDVVRKLLVDELSLTDGQADACLSLAEIRTPDLSFVDRVRALGVSHELLDTGLEELAAVIEAGLEYAPGFLTADLKIARGLDYYTGTVYETVMEGHEDLGSVCSGGRYDSLATDGKTTYPGNGLSIGVSRILGRLFGRDQLTATRSVPTCVLVALPSEDDRPACRRIANALRRRGIATEVSPSAAKFGKQIRYAQRRGIPYVWFPGGTDQVKDIRSGDQVDADPAGWQPPDADRWPGIISG
ncbi:histidine--tRNA ligase [Fodinicola acaciae]|uniref:histidine--tRNA ligase n=1 Tax=Fodinicola acaciae TaxID=2681555 RepID=UPI0013D8C44C|nr:histidine--tRNA ligase [Fodinicola acaciae]